MDFTTTEAQAALGALTREILAGRKPSDSFDRPLWTDLAAAGVLSAALPTAVGGDGYGLLEQCTILSELGAAVAPLPFLDSIVGAASVVARFGSAAQADRFARSAGTGELILTAAAGSVHSRQSGTEWLLDGECTAVPAAPDADLVLVATPDGAFLVAPTDEGVTIETQRIAGGPGAGHVRLASVAVPADRAIADPATAAWLRDRLTVGHCASQLGVLERALELTAEYARTRVQFGRPIGTFQAVAQRLADAYIDVQGVRLTLWQAAWRLANDLPCPTEVATAKFWAAEAGHRVAHSAVHVHGGVGIDLEGEVQRYFLAAKYHEFTLGGATEQLLHIGASLPTVDLDA